MQELAVTHTTEIRAKKGFMVIDNFAQALHVAEYLSKADNCPAGLKNKPNDMLMVLQKGAELGLHPCQAFDCIAFINGKAAVYGDAMMALCRHARNYEYIDETFDDATMTAICKAKRKDEPVVERRFSQKDAVTANLWAKNQVWKSYPKRMLQMRARGFALRDCFADVLKGIITEYEAFDYPEPINVTPPKKPLCDISEADIIQEIEEAPLPDEDAALIIEVFNNCETIDKLRDQLKFYKSGYESKSIKDKITALAMSIVAEKFKKEEKKDERGSEE